MKPLLLIGLLSTAALTTSAQTFQNFLVPTNGAALDIPAGTKLQILGYFNGNADMKWTYEGFGITNNFEFENLGLNPQNLFLGPARLEFQANSLNTGTELLMLKWEAVNVTPQLSGYAVQTSGQTATVKLQSSPDLVNWADTTNGTRLATNSAEFFRLNFQLNN